MMDLALVVSIANSSSCSPLSPVEERRLRQGWCQKGGSNSHFFTPHSCTEEVVVGSGADPSFPFTVNFIIYASAENFPLFFGTEFNLLLNFLKKCLYFSVNLVGGFSKFVEKSLHSLACSADLRIHS